MIKPYQPYSFTADVPTVSGLFAKWLPLYVGQATLDDDEAEPFQKPLQEVEEAIGASPINTMQDLFHVVTAGSFLGTMCCDFGVETIFKIHAVAIAEAEERVALLAMIDKHQGMLKAVEALDDEEWENDQAAKAQEEAAFLIQIAALPVKSIDNVVLKGRYLASLHESGVLGYEFANAFIETFAKIGEKEL